MIFQLILVRIEKPFDESERAEFKSWLKTPYSKNYDHSTGPIASLQIHVEVTETITDYFGGSKFTANGECNHEIKRYLLLGGGKKKNKL